MGGPRDTQYKLARNGHDFKRCHALLRANGDGDGVQLQHPTIYAERDDRMLGFITSHIYQGRVILGGIELASGSHRPWTSMRLIEAYEQLLSGAGIPRFWLRVDPTCPLLQDLVVAGEAEQVGAITDGKAWFCRYLKGGACLG